MEAISLLCVIRSVVSRDFTRGRWGNLAILHQLLESRASGDVLTIHGECVHSGRTTRVVDVDITNQDGANVCKATFTMFVTGVRDESAQVRHLKIYIF